MVTSFVVIVDRAQLVAPDRIEIYEIDLIGINESEKTITFKGSKNCVGEFVDVKVVQVRKSVLYGEIVDDERIKDFKEKSFKNPLEVSILPKDQKSMKLLRENKNKKKLQNDFKSKN